MHETTPAVFLIARPSIDIEGMRGYLRDVGGESWLQMRLDGVGADAGSLPSAGAPSDRGASGPGARATAAGSRG